MNIIQQADALKSLPDQALQQELLRPSAGAPPYLVLSELQRRKEMRSSYASQQPRPGSSLAEEFARGMGSAQVGQYADAMRGAVPGAMQTGPAMQQPGQPPQGPMPGEHPGQTQGFQDGGAVNESPYAQMLEMIRRGYPMPPELQQRLMTQAAPQFGPQNLSPRERAMMELQQQGRVQEANPITAPPPQYSYPTPRNLPGLGSQLRSGTTSLENAIPQSDIASTPPPTGQDFAGPMPPAAVPGQRGPTNVEPPPGSEGFDGAPAFAGLPPWMGPTVSPPGGGIPPAPGNPRGPGGVGGSPGGNGPGGVMPPGGIGAAVNSVPGFVDQVRGMQAPDRFSELENLNRADKEKLKEQLEGDKGMALLTAGLGIMGGTSPNALVNIGRGALAGVQNWNEASKEMRLSEMAIRNADQQIAIARASRDERQLEMAVKTKMHAMEMQERRADRGAAAGDRAAARAEAAEERRIAREERTEDRKENRILRETSTYITEIKTAQDALHRFNQDYTAQLQTMQIPKDELDKLYGPKIKEQQDIIAEAQGKLRERRLKADVRSGAIAQPKSKADFDKLPSGTQFMDPNGDLRIKP